jgi:hypothetical protein
MLQHIILGIKYGIYPNTKKKAFMLQQEKHWCKVSKVVQARNAASEDELVDIW